jgi:superinfection exclusion protein gp17
MAKEGDLKVWWVPQIPGKPFEVGVESVAQAKFLTEVLANYDLFQFENRIKPDYSNTGGLSVYEDGEWCDWEDENGRSIDEWEPR